MTDEPGRLMTEEEAAQLCRKDEFYLGEFCYAHFEDGVIIMRYICGNTNPGEVSRRFGIDESDKFSVLTIEQVNKLYEYVMSDEIQKEIKLTEHYEKFGPTKIFFVHSHEEVKCERCRNLLPGILINPVTNEGNEVVLVTEITEFTQECECGQVTCYSLRR